MTTQELIRVDLGRMRRALGQNTSLDAAILYGSAARGDIEPHSDIDLLLVCSSSRKTPTFADVQELLSEYSHKLSLTIYTKDELEFLRECGSLFLLHLSKEGNVLFDRADFLRLLLDNFQPKSSYRMDFEASLRLMDPLRAAVQGAPNNFHRFSFVYSLFRVFGVYLLAEKGIYEFSKSRMARELADKFPERRYSVELLSSLRTMNSNFFTGGVPPEYYSKDRPPLAEHVTALANLTGTKNDCVATSYEQAVEEFRRASKGSRHALDYRFRMWFLLLVYDGLNLYLARHGNRCLTSLSEGELRSLLDDTHPESISCAAEETIRYLQRYPLKYFLNDESKIKTSNAQAILDGICEELQGE